TQNNSLDKPRGPCLVGRLGLVWPAAWLSGPQNGRTGSTAPAARTPATAHSPDRPPHATPGPGPTNRTTEQPDHSGSARGDQDGPGRRAAAAHPDHEPGAGASVAEVAGEVVGQGAQVGGGKQFAGEQQRSQAPQARPVAQERDCPGPQVRASQVEDFEIIQ